MLPSLRKRRLGRLGEMVRRVKPLRLPLFGRDKQGRRRSQQRFRLLRDVLGGVLILSLILGGLFVATGGTWPPLVVVESGSMMHPEYETSYGRLGTIDVGDVVLVRKVDDWRSIRTWADGGEDRYGRPGDVIAYAQDGDRTNVTIIHRAITYVDVVRAPNTSSKFIVRWTDGTSLTFGDEGIYLPLLGFDERFGFTPTNGYRPAYSGFITKGDNPQTNIAADQAANISAIVDPTWIVGTVHGEIPWMGLGRLAIQTGQTNPKVSNWERVGNAFAPLELWYMFFLVMVLIILVPFTIDTVKLYRQHRSRRRDEEAIAAEMDAQRRKPVEFEPTTR